MTTLMIDTKPSFQMGQAGGEEDHFVVPKVYRSTKEEIFWSKKGRQVRKYLLCNLFINNEMDNPQVEIQFQAYC